MDLDGIVQHRVAAERLVAVSADEILARQPLALGAEVQDKQDSQDENPEPGISALNSTPILCILLILSKTPPLLFFRVPFAYFADSPLLLLRVQNEEGYGKNMQEAAAGGSGLSLVAGAGFEPAIYRL